MICQTAPSFQRGRQALICLSLVLACAAAAAPAPIVENRGQWPAEVKFAVSSPNANLWFYDNNIRMTAGGQNLVLAEIAPNNPSRGLSRHLAHCSYFRGNDPNQWQRIVPTWQEIQHGGYIWRSEGRGLTVESVVPGTPLPEHWPCEKADDGQTGYFPWHEHTTPSRTPADGLVWSTFLGGAGSDKGLGVAMAADGCPVVVGRSRSLDFPSTPGGGSPNGLNDIFVAKLSADGSTMLWSTLLGSSGEDAGMGLALDDQGDIVVVGLVSSGDWPVTDGAYQGVIGGRRDAVVCKLSSDGADLRWSTYLGGVLNDVANRVSIDAEGCPVLVGETESLDWPTTDGAHDRFHGGGWDAFMARLSADGTSLQASTLLGDVGDETGRDLVLRSDGSVSMVGTTASSLYPTTAGAFQTEPQGTDDGYLTNLDPDDASLVWSTRLGGADRDVLMRVALDDAQRHVITGGSFSNDFPVTDGAYDTVHNGNDDCVVACLSADGSALAWSTFLGGLDGDRGLAVALDEQANITVLGYTLSQDMPTTTGAFDISANGSFDVFVHQLNPDGSALRLGTFLGGDQRDETYAAEALPDGRLLVIGMTQSSGFPVTSNAFQTEYAELADAFVALLDLRFWATAMDDTPAAGLACRAFPNPFNPQTTIVFSGAHGLPVTVSVHDLRGRLVRSWDVDSAETDRVTWDGRDAVGRSVATGSYVYRIQAGDELTTGKLCLVK